MTFDLYQGHMINEQVFSCTTFTSFSQKVQHIDSQNMASSFLTATSGSLSDLSNISFIFGFRALECIGGSSKPWPGIPKIPSNLGHHLRKVAFKNGASL